MQTKQARTDSFWERFAPSDNLTEAEVERGLKQAVWDGLTTEMMVSFTSGVFLVAMALLLGATNFQVGLLAALPTATNIFQLISVGLVQRFNNKRLICVVCSFLARLPLVVLGLWLLLPWPRNFPVLFFFLFLYYFFGSVAGPAWNAWMKDLVPESRLGSYFSRRTRYSQLLSILLNLALALLLDLVRRHEAGKQPYVYAVFFAMAGAIGIVGVYFLSQVPERRASVSNLSIGLLFTLPMKNRNFRKLLLFNCAWVFSVNLALPFFTVFMLRTVHLPVSLIMLLTISGQLAGIFSLSLWGTFADKYSNKTIILLNAPFYISCIVAWCFVGIYSRMYPNLVLLFAIHIVMGFSNSGITLALTNIGLKLAPMQDSIVFLSVKNIITAFFSALAPMLGGVLADGFAKINIDVSIRLAGPGFHKIYRLVTLHEWGFLFLIGAILSLIALQLLNQVKETGEVSKDIVRRILRINVRRNMKEYFLIGNILEIHSHLVNILRRKGEKEELIFDGHQRHTRESRKKGQH